MEKRLLSLAADLYGCPNRCLHCWLGHTPNRRMEEGADEFIVGCFSPYFEKIAFYGWLREPDFCDSYRARWEKDLALSKNARPERFELASFWRIARDPDYLPFLKEVGVKKVQLTFFGLRETQDRYVGRRGAWEEVLRATDLLIDTGVVPRWQCFINEENRDEILRVYEMAQDLRRRFPALEFFVHEGSCDGENRKLYPVRIKKKNIPEELIPVYYGYEDLLEERECCEALAKDGAHPVYHNENEIVLNVSNTYDVFFNFTNMTPSWIIGNLKTDPPEEIVSAVLSEDTPALRRAKETSWAELVRLFGDPASERAFSLGEYKDYLFNRFLDETRP